mmetsp:Transcript_15717/g.49206  ORF Transcript_15717/g.49206 Transcript_15717/m.49206 type:complete len:257 (+) Transcript_15717:293-1063(+)
MATLTPPTMTRWPRALRPGWVGRPAGKLPRFSRSTLRLPRAPNLLTRFVRRARSTSFPSVALCTTCSRTATIRSARGWIASLVFLQVPQPLTHSWAATACTQTLARWCARVSLPRQLTGLTLRASAATLHCGHLRHVYSFFATLAIASSLTRPAPSWCACWRRTRGRSSGPTGRNASPPNSLKTLAATATTTRVRCVTCSASFATRLTTTATYPFVCRRCWATCRTRTSIISSHAFPACCCTCTRWSCSTVPRKAG